MYGGRRSLHHQGRVHRNARSALEPWRLPPLLPDVLPQPVDPEHRQPERNRYRLLRLHATAAGGQQFTGVAGHSHALPVHDRHRHLPERCGGSRWRPVDLQFRSALQQLRGGRRDPTAPTHPAMAGAQCHLRSGLQPGATLRRRWLRIHQRQYRSHAIPCARARQLCGVGGGEGIPLRAVDRKNAARPAAPGDTMSAEHDTSHGRTADDLLRSERRRSALL